MAETKSKACPSCTTKMDIAKDLPMYSLHVSAQQYLGNLEI